MPRRKSFEYQRVYFILSILRTDLWSQGAKCVVCEKKKKKHGLHKSKVDRLEHTTSYYQISSSYLTWTTAHVYVVLVSAERLLMEVNTFNFHAGPGHMQNAAS